MRFEFYSEALDDVPKLSVDGTVSNSIHFSHWQDNETPAELRADTSTEIALNLVTSPNQKELTKNIDLITNNHFDTDGMLSVWTVMTGDRAAQYSEVLIAAAEAGDFSEYSGADGVRISLAIQGSDQVIPDDATGSPLARLLAGEDVNDDARCYELIMPEVERLLTNINDYEPLWLEGWKKIIDALESFDRGSSKVNELADSKISLITLAPDIFSGEGFNPTRHSAPYTAISKFAHGELFVIGIPTRDGWFYRIDYPYYSWAETVVRPQIERRDLTGVLKSLNERDGNKNGLWQTDAREMTSAAKFLDAQKRQAPSSLEPDVVAATFASASSKAMGSST
ncbi:MAG TPA: DUF6687 family protein [Pyrinomonadaceae bacterium]|jgi:hypothetical protein|nr:DUF6687 family protein [Pyrinomonadaceae bacterium]